MNLNKMPRALQIVISASRRITLQSPPYSQNKRLKAYREAYGASSPVRLYPASVRAETKTSLPDRYASITFPLIVTHIHNIPWPREHLLLYNIAFAIAPMMEFQPQFTFQYTLNYLWVTTLSPSLIGLSAAIRFWLAKTGANQVWKSFVRHI